TMSSEKTRREFLVGGTLATAGALAAGSVNPAHADEPPAERKEHEHDHAGHGGPGGGPKDRGKLGSGRRKADERPVEGEGPGVPKLPWTLKDGVKEFHLTAEYLKREFLPGMWFNVWGYNGSMPGPTIEVVEGDRVRIMVHNNLPESTSMHWHGLEVPIAM